MAGSDFEHHIVPSEEELCPVKLEEPSPTKTDDTLVHSTTFLPRPGRKSYFGLLKRKLGVIGSLTIFGGTILNIAIIGFLAYLWNGEGPEQGSTASRLWRMIMLRGWAVPTITFSAAILRNVLALQAMVCTSLIAALLLEQHKVPLAQLARVSVLRGINSGPISFLLAFVHCVPRQEYFSLPLFLGIFLALTTTFTQFSSTILVLDVGPKQIIGAYNTTALYIGPKQSDYTLVAANLTGNQSASIMEGRQASGTDFTTKPQTFAAFGQMGGSDPSPNDQGVSDTGRIERAFLPLAEAERRLLREYVGNTTILTSRTQCYPPDIIGQYQPGISLNGSINLNRLPQGLSVRPSSSNCPLDIEFQELSSSNHSYCRPNAFTCSTAVSVDEFYNSTFMCLISLPLDWTEAKNELLQQSDFPVDLTTFLIFNVTGDQTELTHAMETFDIMGGSTYSLPLSNSTTIGEWAEYPLQENLTLTASMCFTVMTMALGGVKLSTNRTLAEPTISWNGSTESWQTEDVRRRFDSAENTAAGDQQGGFSFQMERRRSTTNYSLYDWQLAQLLDFVPDRYEDANVSIPLCPFCSVQLGVVPLGSNGNDNTNQTALTLSSKSMHPHYQALFRDTLARTGRPGLAIQTILAVAAQNIYYDLLPMADVPFPTTLLSCATVSTPTQWRGLAAVAAVVAAEMACVLYVAGLFLLRSRVSSQGNYWQAVSQVLGSPEAAEVLGYAPDLTDSEVSEMLRARGLDKTLVGISRSADSGRVEVTRRGQKRWDSQDDDDDISDDDDDSIDHNLDRGSGMMD